MKKSYEIKKAKKILGIKRMLMYMCSLVLLCCLAACGGGGGDDDDDGGGGGGTSNMSTTMAAEGASILVTVEALDCPITSAVAQDNWLTVEVMPYTSGAPMVKLTAGSNPNTGERKTRVIITGTSQETVKLTVTQKGKQTPPTDDGDEEEEGTGIEDTHNSVTDQPAYAPVR